MITLGRLEFIIAIRLSFLDWRPAAFCPITENLFNLLLYKQLFIIDLLMLLLVFFLAISNCVGFDLLVDCVPNDLLVVVDVVFVCNHGGIICQGWSLASGSPKNSSGYGPLGGRTRISVGYNWFHSYKEALACAETDTFFHFSSHSYRLQSSQTSDSICYSFPWLHHWLFRTVFHC